MKKLISKWPDRLLTLFVPAALVVSFFAPTTALAIKEMSLGGGGTGGGEGDPLDTNDAGGGGGGGSDIHNDGTHLDYGSIWGLDSEPFQVLFVSEIVGGKFVFKIVIVKSTEFIQATDSMGEYHAP